MTKTLGRRCKNAIQMFCVSWGSRQISAGSTRAEAKSDNVSKAARDLLSREEEYKRLNEELEAKTASLVQEAESIMNQQDSAISRPSLLDNVNGDDFLMDSDKDDNGDDSQYMPQRTLEQPISARPLSQPSSSRPSSKVSNQHRGSEKKKNKSSNIGKGRSKSFAADDVAVPDDTFMTQFREMSLEKTIANMEDRLENRASDPEDEDVLPSAAAEMGSEAQIRFLKAKIRVMQEELDRLAQENNKQDEEQTVTKCKLKETEEERARLVRTNAAQQTQIDKYKRLSEDARNKSDSLDTLLSGTKKELESVKRLQKQNLSTHSATEVRLNRALEEVEKYKSDLLRSKSSSKDNTDHDKRRIEQLLAENKRLEKQKNELMTGFKKQMKLIDVLKRQKMHIEAARMLSFTEEEFVKALEWGN